MEKSSSQMMVLESCKSTWVFDTGMNRFRRVLKDGTKESGVVTAWQPYSHIEFDDDSESFSVWLNEEGTRRHRSWRHRSHCDACGGEVTTELNLEAIASYPGV